ncbi:MAG TPA: hypothetical protein VN370_01620 [Desulfitobacteriaceae bacterium]|nr:hypothetical protein [Desulfitobacteriaceae bacterium]
MLMLKICQACDLILGEIEVDNDLNNEYPESIISVVGNVAYALCPDCLRLIEAETESGLELLTPVYH